jgi:hypothetical protein
MDIASLRTPSPNISAPKRGNSFMGISDNADTSSNTIHIGSKIYEEM